MLHYLMLGVRKLRNSPALTLLMVLTLAIGVAASVSTLSVLHLMTSNPIPHKSARLLVPLIDNGAKENWQPGEKIDDQMSFPDASNLLAGKQGMRRTAVVGLSGALEPERPDLPVSNITGAAVTADFFPMFEVPFLYGSPWNAQDESRGANVMVLSRTQSEILFGKTNPVGKRVRFRENDYVVTGVLDTWKPLPRYPHLINGSGGQFNGEEMVYIPFATMTRLEVPMTGSMWCNQRTTPGYQGLLKSECTWVQFWYEVAHESDIPALQQYLNAYVREQGKLGRLPRQVQPQLYDVMAWMAQLKVVKSDSRLAVWLAMGFLLLCLINTIGLLLAKFSTRAAEVGVRRALGASRLEIFKQFLAETAVIGLSGAVLSLPLSFIGVRILAKSAVNLTEWPPLDWYLLSAALIIALTASLLAGLLPTWRACQITPALQLKSQ